MANPRTRFNLKQKIIGPSITDVHNHINKIIRDIKPEIKHLGFKTERFIEDYIEDRRKRKKNLRKLRLSSAFHKVTIDPRVQSFRLGLGNRDILDEKFPYWMILNYGGMIGSTKVPGWFGRQAQPLGGFMPAEGGRGDLFHYKPDSNQKGKFMMYPRKPITGIGYLQATTRFLNKEWSATWVRFKRTHKEIVKNPIAKVLTK